MLDQREARDWTCVYTTLATTMLTLTRDGLCSPLRSTVCIQTTPPGIHSAQPGLLTWNELDGFYLLLYLCKLSEHNGQAGAVQGLVCAPGTSSMASICFTSPSRNALARGASADVRALMALSALASSM